MFTSGITRCFATILLGISLTSCTTAPDITGYPVNTPKFYTENKAFFLQPLGKEQHTAERQGFEHFYQVDINHRSKDVIKHNDPISVVLQGVRLPEDLPGGKRDIAVVLDLHTSSQKGMITLVAFYQRGVPPGQMLNFNNLLVYADPMWDSANPPYFRVRVLDVKAERNQQTSTLLSKVSNLSSQIGGVVPHPAIPLVTSAIDAAGVVLSNRKNVMLMDFQIQFYSDSQTKSAGGATLGPLLAGQWLVLGRAQSNNSDFWKSDLFIDRKTDRVVTPVDAPERGGVEYKNVPVPYVSIVLMKADAQGPQMILDRSEALISLLSTPSGKSDMDSLDALSQSLTSAINAFSVERRLQKYQSKLDLSEIIDRLKDHDAGTVELQPHELRRLFHVLNNVAYPSPDLSLATDWIDWWENKGGATGKFQTDTSGKARYAWPKP